MTLAVADGARHARAGFWRWETVAASLSAALPLLLALDARERNKA